MSLSPGSITLWFEQLRQGDADAAAKLWDRFFERLVKIARMEMQTANRRVADEEDLAAGVMTALCRRADNGQLPSIDDRNCLWRMLLTWTRHDITDHVRADRRLKRGGGQIRGGSVFDNGLDVSDQTLADPAILMEMDEQYQLLLNRLPSDTLRLIAVRKMEGHDNSEIAMSLDVTPRTIQRKLEIIREFWLDL